MNDLSCKLCESPFQATRPDKNGAAIIALNVLGESGDMSTKALLKTGQNAKVAVSTSKLYRLAQTAVIVPRNAPRKRLVNFAEFGLAENTKKDDQCTRQSETLRTRR